MKFSKTDLSAMDSRYRAHFINSLSGFKSANLIGTQDLIGQTNLCIVSSVFHIGADPALIAYINRPPSVERHTLENIRQTGVYTINHVNQAIFERAHHTAARYPKEVSEFTQAKLDVWQSEFGAPYVAQSNIRMGVELVEVNPLRVNNTVMVIGQIVEVHLEDPSWIEADGKIDVEKAQTVCVSGLDEYHQTESLQRLPYAKPKSELDA